MKAVHLQRVAVIVVGAGVVGYGIYKYQAARGAIDGVRGDQKVVERANRRRLGEFESVPFEAVVGAVGQEDVGQLSFPIAKGTRVSSAIDRLVSVLDGSVVVDHGDAEEPLVRSLKRAAAEFVYFRFIRDDAADYLAWRLYRGDVLRGAADIYGNWMVASDYEEYFQEPFPENIGVGAAFEKFYNYHKERYDSGFRAVGMSVESSGLIVGLDRRDSTFGIERVDLGSEARNTLWYEPILGSHRSWFDGGFDFEKNGDLYTGEVGVLIEYEDGSLRPVIIVAMLDPLIGHWEFFRLWTNDFGQSGGLLEF